MESIEKKAGVEHLKHLYNVFLKDGYISKVCFTDMNNESFEKNYDGEKTPVENVELGENKKDSQQYYVLISSEKIEKGSITYCFNEGEVSFKSAGIEGTVKEIRRDCSSEGGRKDKRLYMKIKREDIVFHYMNRAIVSVGYVDTVSRSGREREYNIDYCVFPAPIIIENYVDSFNCFATEESPFSKGTIHKISDQEGKYKRKSACANKKGLYKINQEQARLLLFLAAEMGGVKTPAQFAYNMADSNFKVPSEVRFEYCNDYQISVDEERLSDEMTSTACGPVLQEQYHEAFVEAYLDPEGYKDGRNLVYACIEEPEEPDDTMVHLSLLTPGMLQADLQFFTNTSRYVEEEVLFQYAVENGGTVTKAKRVQVKEADRECSAFDVAYRPYHYELFLNVDKETFIEHYEELYLVKKEDTVLQSAGKEDSSYRLPKRWMALKVFTEETIVEVEKMDCNHVYRGIISFGGSHQFREAVQAIIIKPTYKDSLQKEEEKKQYIEDLKRLYECFHFKTTGIDVIRKELGQLLGNNPIKAIDVWNVGNANCIYLQYHDTDGDKGFFFDIGKPAEVIAEKGDDSSVNTRVNTDLEPNAQVLHNLQSLGKVSNLEFGIISHWHADHIMGIEYLSGISEERIWIAPEIKEIEVEKAGICESVIRAAGYLQEKAKLFMISKDCHGSKVISKPGYNLSLWMGCSESKSDINVSGLILQIGDILLPGDCAYRAWPEEIRNNISNFTKIVVPHHGGALQGKDKDILMNIKEDTVAVISCGDNGYGHPMDDHEKRLLGGTFQDNHKKRQYNTCCVNKTECFGTQKSMSLLP